MTHWKGDIVVPVADGVHVFNGSANFSSKSSSVHAENRFFFQHRPEVADAFRAEWVRQWDALSQPAKPGSGGAP
ncbi:MAG: hypothetical protein FJ087_14985 [Deltaproteobacteria bacterium]|nr:hypothetical protein [Deltaproteobacteria bacterium]